MNSTLASMLYKNCTSIQMQPLLVLLALSQISFIYYVPINILAPKN